MFSSGFIGDQVLGSGDRVHDSGVAYPSLVGRRGGDPRPGSGSLSRDCAAPLAVAFELGVPRKHLDPAHREVVAVGALARRSGGWCQEVLNAGAQVHPRDKRGPPQGKPHPAPYLAGAALLGWAPEECVVFEDSASGVASGCAAGCIVVGTTFSHEAEHLECATYLVRDLGGMVVSVLPGGEGLALRFTPLERP